MEDNVFTGPGHGQLGDPYSANHTKQEAKINARSVQVTGEPNVALSSLT